jgi:uncharacterized membrane protein YfbV (UPF0208 family)
MTTPEEPKKVTEDDIRCSTACTRAGLTVLLFSALAISLLQPIEKKKWIDALETYISLRSTLERAISDLDQDPCWQALGAKKEEEASFEKWNLPKLSERTCFNDIPSKISKTTNNRSNSVSKQQDRQKVSDKKVSPATIPPPTSKPQAGRLIDGVREIIGTLKALSAKKLLNEAQKVSIRYNHYIYRWIILLDQLAYHNMQKEGPAEGPGYTIFYRIYGYPDIGITKSYDTSFNRKKYDDYPIHHLTLADVRKLSSYDPLTFSEIDRPINEQIQFSLSPSAPLLTHKAAAIFVEIVILISLVYFYIFQYEAKQSSSFPAPATLFGVFNRRRLFKFIFYALLLFPPCAAIFLAVWSSYMTYLNFFFAAMIIVVSFGIGKEYYGRRIGHFRLSKRFATALECLTSLIKTAKRKMCQLILSASSLFQRSLQRIRRRL